MATTKCAIPECYRDAMVGIGSSSVWVCFKHYEDYLSRARATMEALAEALGEENQ